MSARIGGACANQLSAPGSASASGGGSRPVPVLVPIGSRPPGSDRLRTAGKQEPPARVALAAPFGSLARGSAGTSSLVGRLIGLPAPSRMVLVDVEAISLRSATVAAVTVPVRGRYSMSVPPGLYLVVVRVSDLRGGRTVTRSSHAALVGFSPKTVNIGPASDSGRVRAHAASSGATVGIGRIPLSVDIPGYRPGGSVEGG